MSTLKETTEATAGRRIAQNTALLTVGQIFVALSMGLWTVMVARYTGPAIFGVFAYAQATITIVLIAISLGLDQLLTRDVAQRPEQGLHYLATFTVVRLALTVVVLAGVVWAVYLTPYPRDHAIIVLIVALNAAVMTFNTLAAALLYAYETMHQAVIAQSANYVLTLGLGALAIWLKQPFTVVLWLSVGGSLVQMILMYSYAARLHPRPEPRLVAAMLPVAATWGLLRSAIPFAALQVLSGLRSNAATFLLQFLTHDEVMVGYFAAAQRIHLVTLIVPDMLLYAVFPAFASFFANTPERFPGMFERAYRYVFLATVPMAVGLWIVAPQLLALIYGPEYAPAAITLQTLSLVLLGGVGWVMGPAMMAMGRQVPYTAIYAGTMALAAAIGFWAIPRYGQAGAAWAVVAGKLLQDAIYTVLMFRWLGLRFPVAWVGKTVGATFVMSWAAALLLRWVHLVAVAFLLAPATYIALLLVLRTFSADDWAYLARLLPGRVQQRLPGALREGSEDDEDLVL